MSGEKHTRAGENAGKWDAMKKKTTKKQPKSRPAGMVSFNLKMFKHLPRKDSAIGIVRLRSEDDLIFFRDFNHLGRIVKELMRGK